MQPRRQPSSRIDRGCVKTILSGRSVADWCTRRAKLQVVSRGIDVDPNHPAHAGVDKAFEAVSSCAAEDGDAGRSIRPDEDIQLISNQLRLTDCRQCHMRLIVSERNVEPGIAHHGWARLTLEQRRVDRRPPPPGAVIRTTLLQLGGRDAPVGDPSPSPWRSASVSSLRSNEAFFFDISRWSSGRLTAYIAHPRHTRQAMKPTHSSRKTSDTRASCAPRSGAPGLALCSASGWA